MYHPSNKEVAISNPYDIKAEVALTKSYMCLVTELLTAEPSILVKVEQPKVRLVNNVAPHVDAA